MIKIKRATRYIALVLLVLALVSVLVACSGIGGAIDPREWGYESQVTYNSLGGLINSKEVRVTFYEKGALIFEPRGTTNMLINPVKDGYILAGWYKDAEQVSVDENDEPVYAFKAVDRWDFNVDRVEESMTLYARWIPQGVVHYVDSITEEVLFSKHITADSPVQPLSSAATRLIDKVGYTMEGYYEDKEATIPYDFSTYIHGELIPDEKVVYEQLMDEFPDAIAFYDGEVYLPPVEDGAEDATPAGGQAVDETEDDEMIDIDQTPLDPQAYIKSLGYMYTTEDEAVLAEIKARKKQIIEESIQFYEENTAGKKVWLNFTEGRSFVVNTVDDLMIDGRYGFYGIDKRGQSFDKYVLEADLDFDGKSFDMIATFEGTIEGNGHSLDNITITVAGSRRIKNEAFQGALFGKLNGATIQNLNFNNFTFNVNLPSTNSLKAAPIAVEAEKSSVKNVTINGLEFILGRGDDGKATYEIADLILLPGDSTLENIVVTDMVAESDHAEITRDYDN